MDRVKILREETEQDGELIEINKRPYNIISPNLEKAKLLETLRIMPIIGRNIKHFFNNINLLMEINKLAIEQQILINNLANVNKEKPIYREEDKRFYKEKIIQNNTKAEKVLLKLFREIKEKIPLDFFENFDGLKRIASCYQNTFFDDNRWFEVITRECVRYVIEDIFHLRKSHYRLYANKNVYGNEYTPFETDVILIFNNTLTIFECRSGSKRQVTRSDFLYFESRKNKVNADRGIFILYEKFGDTSLRIKNYEKNNIFLLDNIKNMKFKKVIDFLKENLTSFL